MCVFHVGIQGHIQIYIIYVHVSLGDHNLGKFYARKMKFGMLRVPTIYVLSRNMKNIRIFYLKIFIFFFFFSFVLVVKYLLYLNRRVFVMEHISMIQKMFQAIE